MSPLLVVGIGNPDCGDDAIGPIVARLLAGRVPAEAEVLERTGDMVGLIEDWAMRHGVVLIDAAALMTAPGTIHRIDLVHETLPAGLGLASSHTFGVVDVVRLARVLGRLPGQMIVYAIEGGMFDPGSPPTAPVAAAADVVATRVMIELNRMAETGP